MRVITGYVTITDQMYRQLVEQREAERVHEHRLRTDPEYAEEWSRHMDEYWDEHDD